MPHDGTPGWRRLPAGLLLQSLVGQPADRALRHTGSRAGQSLDILARLLGVGDPGAVELERTLRQAPVAIAGRLQAAVAAVEDLEQVVLRLIVGARIADLRKRQLGVLDTHFLLAALTEGTTVEADDRRVAEVGIHAVEAGGVGHRHIAVVGPGHGLGHHHLLVLGRIHVALAAHDQLGALHRAVAPDFRVVAVVADDQADLHALRPFADVGLATGIPALDGAPGNDLAVLLDDLAVVVDQHQGVVRRLARMLLVPFAGEGEYAPDVGLAAGAGEYLGFLAGDRHRGFHHLRRIVHDALQAVLGEHHQVHAGQALLHANDHVGNLPGVVQNLRRGVQARHLVVDHRHSDGVVAAGNIAVTHGYHLLLLFFRDEKRPSRVTPGEPICSVRMR